MATFSTCDGCGRKYGFWYYGDPFYNGPDYLFAVLCSRCEKDWLVKGWIEYTPEITPQHPAWVTQEGHDQLSYEAA